jgi:hypothetical protein
MQGRRMTHTVIFAALVAMVGGTWCAQAQAADVTSKVDLSLWGRAKFDFQYDTANLRPNTDFSSFISSDPDDFDGKLNFNPQDTRFGFKGHVADGDRTCGAVMEIDFYGANNANNLLPRMRLGYVFMEKKSFSLRAGQDWIPVAQQNPATLDFGILSWAGNLWWRVPQITARYKLDNGVELLGSVMKHRVRNEIDTQERLPWLLGRVAYGGFLNGKGLVAVGGGFRSVEVDSIDYAPFLAALEFVLPFSDKVQLVGEVYTGAAIGEEFVHYGFEYNPAHPDDAADEGREIATMGGFASLSFQATPKVSISVGGGMDDPDEDDATGMAIPYTKNTVIFGNVKFQPNKNMGMGFEVLQFMTEQGEDANGDTVEWTGQRITGSTWFTF